MRKIRIIYGIYLVIFAAPLSCSWANGTKVGIALDGWFGFTTWLCFLIGTAIIIKGTFFANHD